MPISNSVEAVDAGTAAAWWRHGDALPRFLCDVITSTAARLRPGAPILPARSYWPPDTKLNEAGLGFDSLERLEMASAVSAALCMDHSGLDDYLLTDVRFEHWCSVASESLDRYAERITFQTSGSTGRPKSCPHRLADLLQEVETLVSLLQSGVTRVLTTVPSHHIYGFLFTVLLPRQLGNIPVVNVRGHAPGSVLALTRRGDLVVGHPAYWSAIARDSCATWSPGVTGTTSTAPCPSAVAHSLRSAGLEQLLEIHGSSETGGIGWRDDPANPYALFEQWCRVDAATLCRTELGYGSTRQRSLVQSPDLLEWVDEHRYHIRARRDHAVQVGGINVFPERVRQTLREHPLIEDAAVRLMNPWEGERLKAYIVLRRNSLAEDERRRSISEFVEVRLSAAERPRAFTFGTALPTNVLDKEADWPICN